MTCWSCQATACNKCVQPFFNADLLWTKPQDVCPSCKKSLEDKIRRMADAANHKETPKPKEAEKAVVEPAKVTPREATVTVTAAAPVASAAIEAAVVVAPVVENVSEEDAKPTVAVAQVAAVVAPPVETAAAVERMPAVVEPVREETQTEVQGVVEEAEGTGDNVESETVALTGGPVAASRCKPGPARGRAGSRSTVREQAKKAQEEREREDAELERAMLAAADIPEPERQHLVAEGSVSDKRRSLAGAIPMGMFGGPPPRRPSVVSAEEAGAKAPVVAHEGPQFGMGLGDISSQLGSLRKRAPPAAVTATGQETEKPAVVKPSELRAAALAAKKQEPQLIKAMMRDTLSDLDNAQARTSMSDLSEYIVRDEEQDVKPKASPRVQELDGLIDSARQAVTTPVLSRNEARPPLIVAPEQSPRKTNLEAVSPYNSSPSESPRQEIIEAKTAVMVAPAKSLFSHITYEDMPSPQASRNSMHVVEVGDDEDDSTSEE